MTGRLDGRRLLVVGAGSRPNDDDDAPLGNGRAISLVAARQGASVVCADISATAATATADLVRAEGGTAFVVVGSNALFGRDHHAGRNTADDPWMDHPTEDRDQWLLRGLFARLARNPEAPVFALNEWGMQVELPAELDIRGHPTLDCRAPVELGAPSARPRFAEAWMGMVAKGTGRNRVDLLDGSRVTLVFWDLRERYGVVVGTFLATGDERSEGETVAEMALPDRYGSTRRDVVGGVIESDGAACRMLGWDLETLRALETTELIHPDDRDRALTHWIDMLSSPGSPRRWRGRHKTASGTFTWFEFTDTNRIDDPDYGCVCSEMLDISDEMAAIESLRQRERLLDRLTEALPDGVVQIDHQLRVVHQNERMGEIVGHRATVSLDELFANVHGDDRETVSDHLAAVVERGGDCDIEVHAEVADRGTRVLRLLLRSLGDDDGRPAGAIISVSDVTESSRLRKDLENQARIDALTGCLNRRSLMTCLDAVLAAKGGSEMATTVIFVDLDRFKQVNDDLGHAAGDELLTVVAGRLQSAVRTHDFVGRLGGDEFLVVCPDTAEPALSGELTDRLRIAVEQPLTIAGITMMPTASYGIGWAINSTVTVDELVALADAAMYESKHTSSRRPTLRTVG